MTSILRLAGAILTLSIAFIQPATAAPYVDMGDSTLTDPEVDWYGRKMLEYHPV